MICVVCKKAEVFGNGAGRLRYCWNCRRDYENAKQRAHKHSGVVRKGDMCTYCPAPAFCYDHRDYSRPHLVKLVCKSCNRALGPGSWKRPNGQHVRAEPSKHRKWTLSLAKQVSERK